MPSTVSVDFSRRAGFPLSKTKFGIFDSCFVPVRRYERDIETFAEVGPESLRIDLGWSTPWAGWMKEIFTGTPEKPVYDFSEVDRLTGLLNSVNCLPYWSYCYMFKPLQGPDGDWRSVPCDYAAWGRMLGDVVRHSLAGGKSTRIGYHEIYNEPDNHDFTRATLEEYLEMYLYGARAIREADPDAIIGGPALAFMEHWIAPFLNFVSKNALPLDFFSFHYYGSRDNRAYGPQYYTGATFPESIAHMRNYFSAHPEFVTTEFHINEFNSFPIDYPQDGSQDCYPLPAYLLHDYKFLLEQPDIALVHWAQFLDSGHSNFSGMVTIEGFRKAVFNGYLMYTRMPVDSVQTTVTGPVGLEALSSTDGHTASTLVWNLSGVEQAVTVNLGGTPFSHGQLRVYRIDANHCSYTENHTQERLVPCEVYPEIATQGLTWTGPLDHECVIFFEVNDGSGLSELTTNPVANVLRVNHYYPDRTTRAYADFDKNTWIARLGMEGERTADCEVGVTAEAMPDHVGIRVEVIEPLESLSANSLFGIRVDYRVNGRYTKGVLYHGQCQSSLDLYHPGRTASVPHGTRRQPDEVVAVTDLSAFDLDIASHAPFGWDGRAQIMVILQDAGPSASVKVSFFRPA